MEGEKLNMILAVDIGNSNIVFGVFENDSLIKSMRKLKLGRLRPKGVMGDDDHQNNLNQESLLQGGENNQGKGIDVT